MENRSHATAELIAQAKEATEKAKGDLLKTLEFTPEDRLAWSPSPTARTPLWIAAHCGASNLAFAAVLRGEPLPLPSDPDARALMIRLGGKDVTTRAEAVGFLNDSAEAVLQALDGVTDDMLARTVESPFGAFPFPFWMNLPSRHMEYHRSQLAYLQTIWGDLQDH